MREPNPVMTCASRLGKPVGTLVGVERSEEVISEKRSFWDAYENFRKEYDLAELGIDVEDVYGSIRDRSSGGISPGDTSFLP